MFVKRKPNFERIKKTFYRNGEPDYVPLAEFYIHSTIKDKFFQKYKIKAPETKEGEKNVEREVLFWYNAGYDYVPIEISLRKHPKKIKGTDLARIRESLFLDYTRKDASKGWLKLVEGTIASIDEFEKFPWPEADDLDYSPLERIDKYLPGSMKVIVQPGRMFQAVWGFMGFEKFCLSLLDMPLLVEKMFNRVCSTQFELIRNALNFNCIGAVWFGDDIAYNTSLMLNLKYYQKYLFPWFKKINEICTEKDIPLIYHSDGNISEALNDIINCGIKGIHPFEPKAMDIYKIKKEMGNKICLIGNVDLEYTLTRGAPKEVENEVKQKIRHLGPGGGYCIGSANSIPEYVPYINYEAMRTASIQYGKYPIII